MDFLNCSFTNTTGVFWLPAMIIPVWQVALDDVVVGRGKVKAIEWVQDEWVVGYKRFKIETDRKEPFTYLEAHFMDHIEVENCDLSRKRWPYGN